MVGARTRQAESERKRQRILAAACECFGTLGFSGATVEAIAARADVSNGLLYQFFPSKGELFRVVLRDVVRDWVRAMLPREDEAQQPAGQRLEAMFRRSVEFCRSHPLLPALLTGDRQLQLQRLGSAGQERVQAHRELVAGMLREGIAAGEFRSDLDVDGAADLVCQLQVDYSTRAYRRDPQHPAHPALIDAAVRFIRDALRP